jgi:hypothetical protein
MHILKTISGVRQVLIDGIAQHQPDVVALQKTTRTASHDQVVDILGSTCHVVHSMTRETAVGGVSIASRCPIIGSQELDLKTVSPRTRDFACTTLTAEIEAPPPFGKILVANHFPDYQVDHEIERERQAALPARVTSPCPRRCRTRTIQG